ncbi:MAG TPA: DUF3566 domain-containing protein [Mycobacteriales bacterium]|nr:DUF3566 domain-containing protein [Mycobacteriales bacterium]
MGAPSPSAGERTLDGSPISRPTPTPGQGPPRPSGTVLPGEGRSGSIPPSVGWTGRVAPPTITPGAGAPPVREPSPGPRPAAPPAPARPVGAPRTGIGPRRARLVIRTVDPWSVLKLSLVYSVCLLVVGVVAVAIIYGVLSALGVFDSLSKFLDTVTDAGPGTSSSSSSHSFSGTVVIGGSAIVLAVNALLLTALATLGAFLYNLCASFVGGIEVTLTEPD